MIDRVAFLIFLAGLLLCGLFGFGTSMTFQWPACSVLGLSALLAAWPFFTKGEKTRPATPSAWCLVAGLGLTGYIILRGISSPVSYLAREDLALAGAWFAVWALSAVAFPRSFHRRGLIRVLVFLAIANLALVFWQVGFDPGFWLVPGYSRTYLDRAGGIFNNPNHLAGFLAAVAPLFLALAAWGRVGPHRRILLTFLGVICLLALALTKSRGGILAAGAGMTVLAAVALWLHRSAWKKRRGVALAILTLGIAGAAGVVMVNFQVMEQRFADGAFTRAAETNRPLLWKAALRQNAESPAIGTGSRTFFYYSRKFRPPEMHVSVQEADFAHNDYVQMLADYGWIGVGLLGFFVGAHGLSGLRLLRRYSREFEAGIRPSLRSRHLAPTAGALAGLAALGVHASVEFLLHVPAVAVVAALLLGILANPGPAPAAAPVRKTSLPAPSVLGRLAVPLAGVVLLIAGVRFGRSEWHFERARKLFAGDTAELRIFGHLHRARKLDPANPFLHSLSGHAHLHAIDRSMPEIVRVAYLEKAREHFSAALTCFPQDIYAMLGLAGVLDALERHDEAGDVLERARTWAPLYGNIMHAQGTHFLRLGDLDRAEHCFIEASEAGAFRDWRAAGRALEEVHAARRGRPSPQVETVAGEKIAGRNS